MPRTKDTKEKKLKKPVQKRTKKTTTKKMKTKRTRKQRGGTSLPSAAVDTINSMINLGKSIFNEMDAMAHMGKDFNNATNVKLPNQTTPDQKVYDTSGKISTGTFPKAKV